MKKLTVKQEKFAQLVVKLGNQSEAYRQAYNISETTSIETIKAKASRLAAQYNISTTIERLREEGMSRNDVDIDLITKGLLKVVNDVNYTIDLAKLKEGDKDELKQFYRMKDINTVTDKLKAYDMLIKMYGLNSPEKVETKDTSHKTDWGS